MLRAVSSIQWASTCLSYPYLEKPVGNLCVYRDALERAFEELADPAAIDEVKP